MNAQNTFLDTVMAILMGAGAAAILALISLMITVKLKHKQKHRFDKPPTAKCYCIDCIYHDNETGRCCKFKTWSTADHWFCWNAEPRKTEEKKE